MLQNIKENGLGEPGATRRAKFGSELAAQILTIRANLA
jgi:hypothetical protein